MTTVGRPNPTYGWSTYDWPKKVSYQTGYFTAMTPANVGQQNASFVVTMLGQYAPTSRVGVLFGTAPSSYSGKTPLAAGPTATIPMVDLRPGTLYYCAPYGEGSDGNLYIGAEAQLSTTPLGTPTTVPPNLVAPQSADGSGGGGEVDFLIGTDVPCTGFIDIGPTTAYGTSTAFTNGDGTLGGNRLGLSILGLTPGNTYHWRARVTGKSAPNNVQTTGPDHTVVPA